MVAFAISQPEDVDVNEISFPANTPTTVTGIWKSHMSISRRRIPEAAGAATGWPRGNSQASGRRSCRATN
jgi:hypothetical protein